MNKRFFGKEIKNLQHFLYRYEMFLKNDMKNEADAEAQKIIKLIEFVGSNSNIPAKIQEITDFLACHASFVGQEQAVKDLQRGLSLLNKNRRNSPVEAKNLLKQDGEFAQKTYAALYDVCRNYSVNVIKRFIKKGIMNNIIFDTKNNKKIDTKKLIDGVNVNLLKGGF